MCAIMHRKVSGEDHSTASKYEFALKYHISYRVGSFRYKFWRKYWFKLYAYVVTYCRLGEYLGNISFNKKHGLLPIYE